MHNDRRAKGEIRPISPNELEKHKLQNSFQSEKAISEGLKNRKVNKLAFIRESQNEKVSLLQSTLKGKIPGFSRFCRKDSRK